MCLRYVVILDEGMQAKLLAILGLANHVQLPRPKEEVARDWLYKV
jgi:hypothetical protein